ncbi:uncharacterized protein [Amphiura filiformis]|uniref:uncharacterized protein n=1 Tax=Amphiura filiformis TaxID=82378 RepID=UPI003B215AFE
MSRSGSTKYMPPRDSAVNRIGWEFMECHVCAGRYKKPKILDCLHSVCEECLLKNTTPSAKDVTCPECNLTTPIPQPGGIRSLPSNKFMSGLVQEAVVQEQSNGGGKETCDSCQSGAKPSLRCLDCESFMCPGCSDVHRRDKRNSKHRTASIGDLRNGLFSEEYSSSGTPLCQIHSTEPNQMYCLTCEKSICKDCTIYHHRAPKHKVVKDTREAATKRREVIDKMLAVAEKRMEEFERTQQLVEETESGVHKRLKRAKTQINDEADEKLEIIKKEREFQLAGLSRKMSDDKGGAQGNSLLVQMHRAKDEINAAADAKKEKIEEDRAVQLNKIAQLEEDRGHKLQEEMASAHGLTQRAQYSFTFAMILLKEAGDNHFLSLYMLLGKGLKALIETKPSELNQTLEIVTYSKTQSMKGLGKVSEKIESWNLVKTYGKRDSDDFRCALGIAGCPNGDIALADEGYKRVVTFGLDGEFKSKLQEPSKKTRGAGDDTPDPCGVAINSLGHYIVVDKTKYVKVYDSRGKYLDEFECDNKRAQNAKAVCVAVDSKDRIIIGDKSRAVLTIHSPDGTLLDRLELTLRPWFIAVNSKEQIIISDFEAGTILAIDHEGNTQFTTETIINGERIQASGICCDANDDIFVALHSGDEKGTFPICQFNPRGKFLGCIARGLYHPLGMCFTNDGTLAVADTSSVKLFKM